jgi:ribosome biogenesis GTPase
MKARIVASNSSRYIAYDNNDFFNLTPRGILKKNKKSILVGDIVEYDKNTLTIEDVYPRHNELVRPPIANIDQLLIVSSILEPDFSYELVLKYLTTANVIGVEAKVLITKIDLSKDNEKIEQIRNIFSKLGIKVYFISNFSKIGIDGIRDIFSDKITAFMGQSGVGKSSLLNEINPLFNRAIGEYSISRGRGKHKTKEVILLPFEGGFIADTPGFSSLDIELTKDELAKYYPGISNLYQKCAYRNCLHLSEPKCNVKEAVRLGILDKIIYDCYIKLSSELESVKRR